MTHEEEIVWVDDPGKYDYVREGVTVHPTRRRPVIQPGRVVGYGVLRAGAPNCGHPGTFKRRVFWVRPHDRSEEPDGVYMGGLPAEAVDPRTVAAGVPGKTGRITMKNKELVFARETRGLSQAELAQRVGLSQSQISALENGREERAVSARSAVKLARELDLPLYVVGKNVINIPLDTGALRDRMGGDLDAIEAAGMDWERFVLLITGRGKITATEVEDLAEALDCRPEDIAPAYAELMKGVN